MTDVFILENQHHQFLDKQGNWIEPAQSSQLYRTVHRDEAINLKVEHSVRDPGLRVSIRSCSLNQKGQPQLTPGPEHPTIDRAAEYRFSPEQPHSSPHLLPADDASLMEEKNIQHSAID